MSADTEMKDDSVDRALAALRDVPIPPGPSAELTAVTARRLRQAGRPRPTWGGPASLRLAAAVAIVAGAAVIVALAVHRNNRRLASESRNSHPAVNELPNGVAPRPPGHVDHPAHPDPVAPNNDIVATAPDVSVVGRVFFVGLPPKGRAIDAGSCPQCVQAAHGQLVDDSLIVRPDGALRNVVVSISAGLPPGEQYLPPTSAVMLDQIGCTFKPHVVAAMIGQNVIVRNSDPFPHTVHSTDADETPVFNFAQPAVGERVLQPLQVVETFRVKCDLHPWMNAWVRTFNHPFFAVTGADGAFEIRNLPPGNYRIKAWHESLGVMEKAIRVPPSGFSTVNFSFRSH